MHSVGIDYKQYISNKFIFGISFEKMPESGWTGMSTKSGEHVIVKVSVADSGFQGVAPNADIASQMFITLQCQNILETRDVGVTVME